MSLLSVDRDLARQSYYAATAKRPPVHAPLREHVACDVAIVGAGLAGVTAALELAERGYQVRLVEAREIGWGASGRNGGQAIHGLACDMTEIEAQLGLDDARRVWDMSLQALDQLRERIQRHGIDCDWRDGFMSVATSARKGKALQAWAERTATVYGSRFETIAHADIGRWIDSPRYHSGLYDPRSGHLHPLRYTLGLAQAAAQAGVQIHENTPVLRLERGETIRLHTASGSVTARQVLLAGNVYLQGLAPELDRRIMPVGTYIVGSAPIDPALVRQLIPSGAAVCDTNFVLDYFRFSADHRMLYGGRVSYSTLTPRDLAGRMQRRMAQTFPALAGVGIDHAWGGFVDITMNRAPDFGRLGSNLYYLQGFSGHGLALTGLAGRLVAQAMSGDSAQFDVFAKLKHRPFPGGRWLRTPALVLGMAWYRLRDLLG